MVAWSLQVFEYCHSLGLCRCIYITHHCMLMDEERINFSHFQKFKSNALETKNPWDFGCKKNHWVFVGVGFGLRYIPEYHRLSQSTVPWAKQRISKQTTHGLFK